MTSRHELDLRQRLLEFAEDAVGQDDRFLKVFNARYPADAAPLSEAAQLRHLQEIQRTISVSSNGHAPSWISRMVQGRQQAARTRRWGLALGLAVSAAALLLFAINVLAPSSSNKSTVDPLLATRPQAPPVDSQRPNLPPAAPPRDRHQRNASDNVKPSLSHPPSGKRNKGEMIAARVQVGRFGSVTGEPTLKLPGIRAERVLPNMPIYAGATIETGDMDMAAIAFADGTTVAMSFNSVVHIPGAKVQDLIPARPEAIELESGNVFVVAAHASDSSKFAVKTQVATATVVGTRFSLGVQRVDVSKPPSTSNLKAVLSVEEGRVAFSNEHGTILAGAKTESTATGSSRPTEPRRLTIINIWPIDTPGSLFSYWELQSSRLTYLEGIRKAVMDIGWAGLEGPPVSGAGEIGIHQVSIGKFRVSDCYPGSPLRNAGLQVGDVILALNNKPIRSVGHIHQAIWRSKGKQMRVTVTRGERKFDFSFVPVRYPFHSGGRPYRQRIFEASWPLALNDPKGAIRKLTDLLKVEPSAGTLNNIGVAYEVLDDLGNALRFYKRAVHLDPNCSLYRYNLGTALSQIGNYERAAEELRQSCRLDTRAPGPALGLVQTAFNSKQLSLMVEHLASCKIRFGNSREYWHWASIVFARSKGVEKARAAALKCIESDPSWSYGYTALGNVLLEAGRAKEAEVAYRRSIALSPQNSDIYVDLGLALGGQQKRSEAIQAYRRALELKPDFRVAHANLAQAYTSEGKYDLAISETRKALMVDRAWSSPLRIDLVATLYKGGRAKEAEVAVRASLRDGPPTSVGHDWLGYILMLANRLQEAEAEFRKALKLDPTFGGARRNLGQVLFALGRMEEAEAELRKATKDDPQSAAAHDWLGFVLTRRDMLPEAEVQFRRALEIDPVHFVARRNLVYLLNKAGRGEEALEEARRGVQADPTSPAAHSAMGSDLMQSGRLQEAEPEFRKALALDPSFAGARRELAFVLMRTGRPVEAEIEVRKAIADNPKDQHARAGLVELLTGGKRNDEAESVLRRGIELSPTDEMAYGNFARFLAWANRMDEALTEIKKSIALDPLNPRAYRDLGTYLQRAGRLQEAIIAVKKAVELSGKDHELQFRLAMLYSAANMPKEAEAAYRAAVAIAPESSYGAYVNLGIMVREQGHLVEAEAAFRKAMAIAPDAGTAYTNLGELLETQGKLKEADEVRREGIRRASRHAPLLNSLAWSLAERGIDLDDALAFAKRAREIAPTSGPVIDTLGWIHYKRGEFADAETQLRKAIELYAKDSSVAEVWVHLGAVYEKMAKFELAKEAYKQALTVEPFNKEAAEALRRLGLLTLAPR